MKLPFILTTILALVLGGGAAAHYLLPDKNGIIPYNGKLAKGRSALVGTVKDSLHHPIQGVHVIAINGKLPESDPKNKKYEIDTDEKGSYILYVPSGSYVIEISKDGFQNEEDIGATAKDGTFWQDDWEPRTLQAVAEENARKAEAAQHDPVNILHHLNFFDARDRCGEADYESAPAIAMRLVYKFPSYSGRRTPPGLKDGEVELTFKSGYSGPTVMYSNAEFQPSGSNHDASIPDGEVVKYLPCLAEGGMPK